MRWVAATCAAMMVFVLTGSAQTPVPRPAEAPRIAPDAIQKTKSGMQDVVRVGCLKAWQPGPQDATRVPDAPRTGTYILAPLTVDPSRSALDAQTYVLVGGATANFAAHLNHTVEISGVEAPQQMPPAAHEVAAAPTTKPENKPDTKTMPSLTVQSLKMLSPACP